MPTGKPSQVVGAEAFGARAKRARELFEQRGAPIPSQSWLAAKATSFLEGDVISQTTVGAWLAGKSVPETSVRAWAFAKALAVDPGWLVFGGESLAPAPQGHHPVARSYDETPEAELDRPRTQAVAEPKPASRVGRKRA